MTELTYNVPAVGAPHSTEDPKTRAALIEIKSTFNGGLDSDNLADGAVTADKLSDAVAEALGINKTGNAGRDYATVATSQTTTSSTFTDLSTVGPSVTVDVPTDGFVYVYIEATVNMSTSGQIAFVGLHEATDFPSAAIVLATSSTSAVTMASVPGEPNGVNKATAAGGFLQIPATAGTRTYTLKYARSSTGTATFSNRKIWVIAQGPM